MWITSDPHYINMSNVAYITRGEDDLTGDLILTLVFTVVTSSESGAPYPQSLELRGNEAREMIRALRYPWSTAASEETAP